MKKIVLFFLFVISIFSFATEKSAEQIMDELREKVAKREEAKLHEEEVKKQKKIENEKEAMKLLKEKRRQITEEPLEEKFSRAEDKAAAYEKALEIAEARMSFIEVKDSEDPTLKAYKTNISQKYDDVKKERQKILAEREKIEKQLKDLDELEKKVKDW
ncbi:stress response protein NST1 [Fusobacterium nucleatum]